MGEHKDSHIGQTNVCLVPNLASERDSERLQKAGKAKRNLSWSILPYSSKMSCKLWFLIYLYPLRT